MLALNLLGTGSWCWWAWAHTDSIVLLSLPSAAFPGSAVLQINMCHEGNQSLCWKCWICSGKAGNYPGSVFTFAARSGVLFPAPSGALEAAARGVPLPINSCLALFNFSVLSWCQNLNSRFSKRAFLSLPPLHFLSFAYSAVLKL